MVDKHNVVKPGRVCSATNMFWWCSVFGQAPWIISAELNFKQKEGHWELARAFEHMQRLTMLCSKKSLWLYV